MGPYVDITMTEQIGAEKRNGTDEFDIGFWTHSAVSSGNPSLWSVPRWKTDGVGCTDRHLPAATVTDSDTEENHVKWFHLHQGTARPHAADGADVLQVWKAAECVSG